VFAVALDGYRLHSAHMAKKSAGFNFGKTMQLLPFHEAALPFGDGDIGHSVIRTCFGSAEKANIENCGSVPVAPQNIAAMKCRSGA